MQARLALRLMPRRSYDLSYSKGMRFAYHSGKNPVTIFIFFFKCTRVEKCKLLLWTVRWAPDRVIWARTLGPGSLYYVPGAVYVPSTSFLLGVVPTGSIRESLATGSGVFRIFFGFSAKSYRNFDDTLREQSTIFYEIHLHNFCTYIHTLLYWPSYAANISEHLAIRWETDHHTGNYVPYSFRTVYGFFYVPQN